MIDFLTAKNGNKTCAVRGKYLHSLYNPEREAERFANTLQCDYNPQYIVITEPALSYCAIHLKKRFPKAKLCAIRYCNDFNNTNTEWNYVFRCDTNLDNALFDKLGEEGIAKTLFASWQPSESAFEKENRLAWEKIKAVVLKSRDVIGTRSYFAKRWTKNTIRFFSRAKNIYTTTRGKCDIIVAASGPSLEPIIANLKEYREKYFLLAVSSAIKPLLYHGITPDLCISTDGGEWAKRHLEPLYQKIQIPIALSAEAAVPAFVLENSPILPLVYGDSIEAILMNKCKIEAVRAYRNGTVSGTAVELALSLTTGNIYCTGLDLCEAKGFQHTRPNVLDTLNSLSENRLFTAATRLALSGRPNGSLKIYRDWFSSRNDAFSSRIKRFATSTLYPLGKIKDISTENCIAIFKEMRSDTKPEIKKLTSVLDTESRKKIIETELDNISKKTELDKESEIWLKNMLPSQFLHYEKYIGTEKESEALKELFEKKQEMQNDI